MRLISLFAGIGGFDLGAERAGLDVVLQVEVDPHCRRVLERHWPDVRRIERVEDVKMADLDGADVICGGFPCQDLSQARSDRDGLAGERSGLFWQLIRCVGLARPAWVLVENVPGLLSHGQGADHEAVLAAFAMLGYFGAWRVLDSQHFGVAQRRRRVFFLLARGDLGGLRAAEVLLEPEGVRGDLAASRAPGPEATQGDRGRSPRRRRVVGTLEARDPVDVDAAASHRLIAFDATQITSGENRCRPQPGDPCHPLVAYGRPPTIAGRGGEGVSGVRRLTPLECERLQGFPDGWTCLCGEGHRGSHHCTCSLGPRYRALGNAVTVSVAEWILARLALEEE